MQYRINSSSGVIVAGGLGPGMSNTQLHTPYDVYYDGNRSTLYIVNFGSHNVVRWVLGASSWTIVAGSPSGSAGFSVRSLYQPRGLAFDQYGNMYIADSVNHRIQFFLSGQINATTIIGSTGFSGSSRQNLYYPFSVILDNLMNLYVADTYNHRIQMFTRY